jgi:hypothetical protein
MRMSFLGLAASVCMLPACSGNLSSPNKGDSNMPGVDANADREIPGTDANLDVEVPGTDANMDAEIPGADAHTDFKIPGTDAHVDLRPLACGSDASGYGRFNWADWSLSPGAFVGSGTATLRSEGGITRLELTGNTYRGSLQSVEQTVTATLTGGETLLAGTYFCGQDAVAGYRVGSIVGGTVTDKTCWASTPTADCPGQVAACAFTLGEQIWPGCFEANAKGTFWLILTGGDAGTVTISDGSFDVPIVEPLPPR